MSDKLYMDERGLCSGEFVNPALPGSAREVEKALHSLYLVCDAVVADEVNRIVRAEIERLTAALADAERVIQRAAALMRGDGVEDQGEAWDQTLRLLDAHIDAIDAAKEKREPLVRIDPGSRAGKAPCPECHIQPGETCDICGAKEKP